MKQFINRLIALSLAFVMVFGMLPVSAFASDDAGTPNVAADGADNGTNDDSADGTDDDTADGTDDTADGTDDDTADGTDDDTADGADDDTADGTDEATDGETEEETGNEDEIALIDEESSPYSLKIASSSKANLAPGVTETTVVAYDKNGDRVQYFVVNANIATNSTVQVKANYQNNDNTGTWGKATVVEQANAAKEKRGYNVVASTNASYYNVSTGQPSGGFVMEGVNINGNGAGDAYPFFAVLKDGTAMIGEKGTFSKYADQIQEAVGGWTMLVWNGKLVATGDSKYPRSTVGIKENGDVVLMLADGNNKPYSAGLTLREQGQLMLELGCVAAVELDGGGSATYAAKLEGMDEIEVRNVCCDGTVRSVSNTLMVISTAVADGTFDHANLSTEYAFHAPNSEVEISAVPVDAAGNAAEMPEDVIWSLSDDSFGTIADGIFTSNGKTGTVTVKLSSGGKDVGSVDVTMVHPSSIAFSAAEKTVPYGKTSDFTVTAMHNGAEVYAAADAYNFEISAGSMDGFIYTAPSDNVLEASVTATYKYAEVEPAVVKVTFGKGSDILYTFETDDPDRAKWGTYFDLVDAAKNGEYTNGYSVIYQSVGATDGNLVERGIRENVFLASRADGAPVYSGDYSLGYTLDYTQSVAHANWQYAYLYFWGDPTTWRDVNNGINGTRLGMWMYIPEEAVGSCARLCYTYTDNTSGKINTAYLYFTYQYVEKGFSKLTSEKIPEAGWAYVYCDMDQISNSYVSSAYYKNADGTLTREATSNYAPAFIQFIVSSSATGAEKCTFYIDDITLDYSDVVDDRDAPIISNPLALDDQNSYAMGSSLSFNTVSFTANVAEDTSHGTNFTGLDSATAQIYVDGQEVATSYSAGKIATANLNLPNGTHDVTFEIADNQGNYTKLTKQITINGAETYPMVFLDGSAPAVNKDGNLYTGAQYNLLLKTDKVEAIDTITTKIWLNSASKWSLENMSILPGFTATYTLDELACMATITVKRTGDVAATGAATLATIPVYAWSWDGSAGWDSKYQWNTQGCAPQITVSFDAKYGKVTYTDEFAVSAKNYVSGFGSARKDVGTELNSSIANLKPAIGIWHIHTPTAIEDKANTCTTDGYTDRMVCSVCNSILTWGTTKATGHNFALTDGAVKCRCGETFTGTWTDGKLYVDGALKADGWDGECYYKDGVKLTGIQQIDGLYYDLGEDGISKGKLTGLVTLEDKLYNLVLGEKKSGWQYDSNKYYYFDPVTFAAVDGIVTIDGYTYEFEDNTLIDGHWLREGGKIYLKWAGSLVYRDWMTIKGKTYHFDQYGVAATGEQRLEKGTYSGIYEWYLFDENGVFQESFTGFHEHNDGNTYYFVNGIRNYAGLLQIDGDYYYVNGNCQLIKGSSYSISKTNGLKEAGLYEFDADGKMILPDAAKNGVYFEEDGVYYYKDGQLFRAGLVEHEGDYYYFGSSGKAVVGYYGISKTNGLMEPGGYTFGEDGKMIIVDETKDGIYFEEDGVYYYKNGALFRAGLVEHEGAYYYFNSSGKAVTGVYGISQTNGLMDPGAYTFGEDGKMIIVDEAKDGIYFEEDGVYYYKEGKLYRAGLVEYEGAYYYFNSSGKAVTGVYGISQTNGLMDPGAYTFGEDGKMILPDPVKNGIYFEEDGVYYYQDGKLFRAGLVEHEGSYYYFGSSGKAVTGVYGISKTNGLMEPGAYTFGEDGKMIIG